MFFKIIGSAAGGGFPQWNCNSSLSQGARNHHPYFAPRTQSSLIASHDGKRWVLFNASPDLRQQILNTPQLYPNPEGPLRSTPIAAVVLTNADIDHIAGLLTMRERQAFNIYATQRVLTVLEQNPVFRVLDPELVSKNILPITGETVLKDCANNPLDIVIESFTVPGKVALFMEDIAQENFGSQEGDTIGLRIYNNETKPSLFYIPGCAEIDDALRSRLMGAECLLFDGTLYTDDEMLKAGLGHKTGQRMGHISMSGPHGSVSALGALDIKRKIFVHINNSNPVLNDASPERLAIEQAGFEVAYDGMEIKL